MNKNTTIRRMWRLYKKWWLLQQFHKGIYEHTKRRKRDQKRHGESFDFVRIPLTKEGLLRGTEKDPGLVFRNYLFWWIIKPKYLSNINEDKWVDLEDIYESCLINNEYLSFRKDASGNLIKDGIGQPIIEKGEKFEKEMYGWLNLISREWDTIKTPIKVLVFFITFLVSIFGINGQTIFNYIKNKYNEYKQPKYEQIEPKNEVIKQNQIPRTAK